MRDTAAGRPRNATLHALMALLTMQAAAVRAEAGEVERVREVSRWVA